MTTDAEDKPLESEIDHFPGPLEIGQTLMRRHRFKTRPENGTDKEDIYVWNQHIYVQADEFLKEELQSEFLRIWKERLIEIKDDQSKTRLKARLQNAISRGPSTKEINEAINSIRRMTLTDEPLNPANFIPFLNGLINLETGKLEPFSPDLFITYQVNANYIEEDVFLEDTPLFRSYLETVYNPCNLIKVLAYWAYSFYPDLPVHKVLIIVGRERIGKGTGARIIKGLLKEGYGSFDLSRLLVGERFQYTGIEGKNLLVDAELKRKFRRGMAKDWKHFNELFGGDTVSLEKKGKEAKDYVNKAKGIILSNLPLFEFDNAAAVERFVVVETKDEKPTKVIPNYDQIILNEERDKIAKLLLKLLLELRENNFNFYEGMNAEEKGSLLDQLADPVEFFIEDATEYAEGINTTEKDAYDAFKKWCVNKGIVDLPKRTFVSKFKSAYKKVRKGERGKQEYQFENCKLMGIENNTPADAQAKFESGYGVDTKKPSNNTIPQHDEDCIQIPYRKLIWKKYNNENSIIKENVRNQDTENNDQKPAVNQQDGDNKPVSISPDEESYESGFTADSGFGTDFYRIKIAFQYEFEKDGRTIKVNCREGEVRKLSEKTAVLHRAYLEKACPKGHWDSIEKQCIADENGGEPHE